MKSTSALGVGPAAGGLLFDPSGCAAGAPVLRGPDVALGTAVGSLPGMAVCTVYGSNVRGAT